jgi:hypothetical protein
MMSSHLSQPAQINETDQAPRFLRRATRLTAALVSAALLAAGCGGTSSSNPGPSAASFTAAAFRYASCMRQHGLSSFADPSMTDHNGQNVGYFATPGSLVASPTFKRANKVCQGILLPDLDTNQAAAAGAAREQHMLAFAKCIRGHRVPRFPDPTTQGQLTQRMINRAGIDLQAPAVLAAARACLPAADGAITAQQVQQAINAGQ